MNKIYNRFTSEIIIEGKGSVKKLVEKNYANLRYADLGNANLGNANLRNANLRNANLRNADLRNANLRYANLRYADLGNANLRNADLRNADLRNANLGNANLRIFCANNLCQHHVHVSYQIYHQGYMTLDTGERVNHYPYRRINGEDTEVLMFCEVCKNAIYMTKS